MKQRLVSTPIKSMGKVITGRTPSTKNQEYYGDDYFFISPADLGEKKYVSDSIKKLSDLGIEKANKLPPQTILFTCIGSTIGKIGMSENECATNQQINAVVVDKKNFDPNYVYYQLARHSLRIAELAGRQAVPIVNKSTFESYEISIHPLEEQRKIAQILSTWDEAIEAVEELIEKKKKLFYTLLNSYFSRDENKKWVKLNDVGLFSKGKGVSKSESKDVGLPCVRYGELYTEYATSITKTVSFIDNESASNSTEIKYGDILFAGSGETNLEIGKSAIYLLPKGYAGGDIIILGLVNFRAGFASVF